VAGGVGPRLTFSGAPVAVDMWTGWAPIGAEQSGTGYDVAWKNESTGQYNIWSTDSNGSYVANLLSFVSGRSAALQSYETTFHQDLNSDGVVAIAAGSSSIAMAADDTFVFHSIFAESNNFEYVPTALLGLNADSNGARASLGPSNPVLEAVTQIDANVADLLSGHFNHLAGFAAHDLLA
ncbi:hypothetical protein I6F20_30310, partial [Bradyrhizobium sp. IC3123]|nr:hypothetical protein [Bradyrhizobium sp. IC3123]